MKNRNKKIIALMMSGIVVLSVITGVAAEKSKSGAGEVTYNAGEEIKPNVRVMSDEGVQLENGVDYDLSYENNINVGTATVHITFKGNYTGTRDTNFNIVARTLSNDSINIDDIASQTYTGAAITPEPTIKYGEVTLVKDKDYTLSYQDNINVGTAKINISFIGNYSGSANTNFEITADILNNDKVSISETAAQTYTGVAITPEPTIKYGEVTLVKDKDYTLSYQDNVNVGTAKINVSFIGNYGGSANATFAITPKIILADDKNISISAIEDQTYTGSPIEPQPVIIDISR